MRNPHLFFASPFFLNFLENSGHEAEEKSGVEDDDDDESESKKRNVLCRSGGVFCWN